MEISEFDILKIIHYMITTGDAEITHWQHILIKLIGFYTICVLVCVIDF